MPEKRNDTDERSHQQDPIVFMRSRHPDLYSDSKTFTRPGLTEDILEYRLQTLTNRNQETEFAYFARRLAQKEICPNLRPQTGPVGGGDSKVDSETIPVSSDVADVWVGTDPSAATERWAFAFSAKKGWKAKAAQDVENIAGTNRRYTRIYFITNQFARDKSRAESEDALYKKFGIPVVILDRTWITRAVFENGREELAIEALHIDSLKVLVERRVGPADRERQEELDELESAIADPELYAGAQYQLFEDCLRAALLARSLGRPRSELDGLFARAQRIADKSADDRQRLRVAYNYAWTLIFWFDDYNQLNQAYDTVAALALKSSQSEEVERAVNLWMVLSAQVDRGVLTKGDAKLDQRKAAIVARLDELVAEESRPNNALEAKTTRTLLDLYGAMTLRDRNAADAALNVFQEIVEESESLGDYPFYRLPALVREFADLGMESAEFDKLFEIVITALEKREGDAAGAELLNDRGFKKLEAGHAYEAISLLGRAMERFIKREHRDDLILCLVGLSGAYHEAGLLWAARSCALTAVERCFAYFHESGTIVRQSLFCMEQLERMELLLGRIPQLLMVMELKAVLVPQFMLKGQSLTRAENNRELTEGMLSILFLSASLDQLKRMEDLPEALEQIGVFVPKGCLMYALGYKKELLEEGFRSVEEADSVMKLAYEQPGRLQLPARPQMDDGESVTYKTTVLGCEVCLVAQAEEFSISVAEAILSSIEAFFATSLNERILPYRQSVRIILRPVFDLKEGLSVSEEMEGARTNLVVLHPVSAPKMTAANRMADRDGLMEIIAKFISHIAVIVDVNAYFEKIAGEERGMVRALVYSEASLVQENVFGNRPKVLIGDWKPEAGAERYPLIRSVEWIDGVDFNQLPLLSEEQRDDTRAQGEAEIHAQFMRAAETGKHNQRRIVSLIDIPLWDRASWKGTVFYFDPDQVPYPILALGFEDRAAAAQIFEGLIDQLGQVDTDNRLRVVIVRGIRKDNPAAYRVVVGTNLDRSEADGKIVMMVTRNNVMAPASSENLDRFLTLVTSAPDYLLSPAHLSSELGGSSIGLGLAIQKSGLVVRNAWEIGMGDVDVMGLSAHDDPVIPADVKDPPCEEVIAFLKSRQRR